MEMEYVVIIAVPILTGIAGWVGNHISNRPKRENNNMNKIQLIIAEYEKMNQRCEERNLRMCEENRDLRDKNRNLKKELEEGE